MVHNNDRYDGEGDRLLICIICAKLGRKDVYFETKDSHGRRSKRSKRYNALPYLLGEILTWATSPKHMKIKC